MSRRVRASSPAAWAVVTAVGAVVLIVVFALQLFPRLSAGQDVVDGLEPAVQDDRVATARGGVDMVATIVDLADPLMLESGGAAGEIPGLVGFVADGAGLDPDDVVAAIDENFPHIGGLLRALPLEQVAGEVPDLVSFVAGALDVSDEDVLAALAENFPWIYQAVTSLVDVSAAWADVPDTPGTRFDGAEVATARDVSDFFSDDVVPVLERQGGRINEVAAIPGGVGGLPTLLLVIGIVVVAFGVAMMLVSRGGGTPRNLALGAWSVVVVVGLFVVVVVFGFQLYPRLSDAHLVLDDAKPAFTDDRVANAVGGIEFISRATDMADPIVLESGGAAAEVPELVSFVADGAGLTEDDVVAALGENFPHVLGLLQALPLEGVADEVPGLVSFVASTLSVTEADVMTALGENFPALAQALVALPEVVGGWEDVPGTPGPRFDGQPIQSVPDVRDYFHDDLVPAVGAVQPDFQKLESTWPPTYFFPPLLTIVGLLVIGYGVAMLVVVVRSRGHLERPGSATNSTFAKAA